MTTPNDLPSSDQTDRPHKPADDSEEVYYHGSPLLRGDIGRLLVCMFFGLIIAAAPIGWNLAKNSWPAWWITLACVVIGILVLLIPLIATKMIRYRISNYRIDFERGILSRSIDTLELWHVEDIAFHQSLIDRIVQVGNITVISHDDTTPKLELRGLPNPRPLFDMLKQRIIAVKRQRGVIKMDVG